MPERPAIGFIGAGNLACTLAVALEQAGYTVRALTSRTPDSAGALAAHLRSPRVCATAQEVAGAAGLVFITTPDDAIETAAAGVRWRPAQVVAHCSGAHSTAPLAAGSRAGAWAGVLHPLQTFPRRAPEPERLHGCSAGVTGHRNAVEVLGQVARDLGMCPVAVPEQQMPLYHLAAVFASNYLVALAGVASGLWAGLGIERAEALRALAPLMRASVENLALGGLPAALSGPIARGDLETVRHHLSALEQQDPGLLPLYRVLGARTIGLALEKGLGEEAAAALAAALGTEQSGSARTNRHHERLLPAAKEQTP